MGAEIVLQQWWDRPGARLLPKGWDLRAAAHAAQMVLTVIRSITMKRFVVVGLLSLFAGPIAHAAEQKMWVKTDTVARHTCPSTECGMVGKLYFREAVTVLESRNGWARITELYDASCHNSNSEYVDFGWRACSPENGIVNGQFAEWVRVGSLAATRPPDPGASATGFAKLVAQSDDYQNYAKEFERAAIQLIESGRCSREDFLSVGGWIRSTRKGPGMYFTYCKNGADQVYLNVRTGRTQ